MGCFSLGRLAWDSVARISHYNRWHSTARSLPMQRRGNKTKQNNQTTTITSTHHTKGRKERVKKGLTDLLRRLAAPPAWRSCSAAWACTPGRREAAAPSTELNARARTSKQRKTDRAPLLNMRNPYKAFRAGTRRSVFRPTSLANHQARCSVGCWANFAFGWRGKLPSCLVGKVFWGVCCASCAYAPPCKHATTTRASKQACFKQCGTHDLLSGVAHS